MQSSAPDILNFTVAIRAYNAADRLPTLLEAILTQTGLDGLTWETVIIDNCSTDDTAAVVQRYQANWPKGWTLRYYQEPQQGAVFARWRAIREAQGEWIGFLDDDNIPEADWVAAAYTFGQAHPRAGACGSQIHGHFEVEPPEHFQRIAHFLPVIERDRPVCFTTGIYARKQVLPPGAGLMIRRQAWLETVPEQLVLSGPVGEGLAAKGEDIEALSYLKQAGWEIWFNPEMHIVHWIPQWRFEREYLCRFFRGIGLGRYYTRMVVFPRWQRFPMTLFYLINDLRKLLMHCWHYRHLESLDVVTQCERELFQTSVLSPFYHLLRRWKALYVG